MQSSSAVTGKHYAAIFTLALSAIAVQLLFSRIFSVTFYYHLAFAGITFAMLGLTAGALRVYREPERFSAANAGPALARCMTWFSIGLAAATILHVHLAGTMVLFFIDNAELSATIGAVMMLGSIMLLLFAFVQSGIGVALLLTRFPSHTGKLYAYDLLGAALGCIVIILALKLLDPVSVILLLCTAVTLVACRMVPADGHRKLARHIRLGAIVLALLCAGQSASSLMGAPLFHLTWTKGLLITQQPLLERWNTYSRVAVWKHDKETPFGWGFGHEHHEKIEQKFLNIDAEAATILTSFDGDTSKLSYLKDDISNLAYHVRKMDRVAVVGVGGGRDILSGLVFGAKHIKGIELNPAIFETLTDKFGDFTGHLERRPDVSLTNAEARSYLASHQDTYDLIQISLIDTWASTAAGGLTLSENKLYTTDAWEDFLRHLNSNGMLMVSRWFNIDTHPGEFYRLLSIAADTLKTLDPKADTRKHLLAASVKKIVTVIVSKSPLTPEDLAHFRNACEEHGFTPLLAPDMAINDIASRIADGKADAVFYDSLPIDVTASNDDRPFFFYMLRPSNFFGSNSTTLASGNAALMNNVAVATLCGLFVFTLIASIILIGMPMKDIYIEKRMRFSQTAPYMLYFSCIGLGFMLIEISQMQRLMIFLGHPIYGLSVVLFTLLLSNSAGSYSQRGLAAGQPGLWLRPLLLCCVLALTGLFTPLVTEQLKIYDTTIRIIASGLLIVPMGLCMGMMFPLGVALASPRQEDLLPWYWGINGAASVFASVFAVILSLQFGISATFWAGVCCYGLCLLCVLTHGRSKAMI